MKCIAIIPARGGSKGTPIKNIYPLAGKPLLAYNLLSAVQTPLINRVVVSTDDSRIAEVAGHDIVKILHEVMDQIKSPQSKYVNK